MWAFPSLLIIGAVGLGILSRGLSRGDTALERRLFATLAVVAVASSFVATLRFGVFYGQLAGEVYRRDVAAAEWISRELPPGVAIANVATSVEYLTGHRNLNLHGVTSPQFFGNRSAEREAGTYEAMTRLPQSERPDFLLTTEATQQANETLRALEVGPALFRSTSFGDEIVVHRIQWDVVGRGAEPLLPESLAAVADLREVDRLNVCDSRDERSHGYRFSSERGGTSAGRHGARRQLCASGAGRGRAGHRRRTSHPGPRILHHLDRSEPGHPHGAPDGPADRGHRVPRLRCDAGRPRVPRGRVLHPLQRPAAASLDVQACPRLGRACDTHPRSLRDERADDSRAARSLRGVLLLVLPVTRSPRRTSPER